MSILSHPYFHDEAAALSMSKACCGRRVRFATTAAQSTTPLKGGRTKPSKKHPHG